MTGRILVAALLLAVCPHAEARRVSSRSPFPAVVMEDGAVSELSLQVPPDKIEEFLSLYTKWFFPVDVAQDSGRRLLAVLSREHGDEHSLVFLYWYESSRKEGYECKFAKAFFSYHLAKDRLDRTGVELGKLYEDATRVLGGGPEGVQSVLTQLEDCRAGTQVPPAVAETIRRIDEKFRLLGGTDTLSWSFGVNPCRAHMFFEATKAHRRLTEDELSACGRSLLEAALSATAPPRR